MSSARTPREVLGRRRLAGGLVTTATVAPPGLELRDIRAGYGRIEVLHGVSLTAQAACLPSLPQRRGQDDNAARGVRKASPDLGVRPRDRFSRHGTDPGELARAGICRSRGRGVFPNLTVAENLRMFSYSSELSMNEIEDRAYTRFPRLRARPQPPGGALSGGEQQMLACRAPSSPTVAC